MAEDARCELCRDPLAPADHRVCGVDLCTECARGDLRHRLRLRGFDIAERKWTKKSRKDDGVDTHHTEVTGIIEARTGVRATFTSEGLGIRIKKFFGGERDEVQAGDSIFDDAIFVDTDTPDETRELLQHEGLQFVILEAVAELEGIRIEPVEQGTKVTVHTTWSTQSQGEPPSTQQRTVAVALHHISARI